MAANKKNCATPILLTKTEWSRIEAHCADKPDSEALRKSKRTEYLDQLSRGMTKQWPNSVENVNRRNEEIRRARIRTAEEANEKFYAGYLERQREEQRLLMERARDAVFKNKDSPKLLLRAVIECATQAERAAQLEFKRKLENEEAILEQEYADHITKESAKWLEEQNNKKLARFLKNKELQKEICEQREALSDRVRREEEEELRLQILDNVKAKQQMEMIAEFERDTKAQEKARIRAAMAQASHEVEQRKHEEEERDKLDEQLRNIYLGYKAKVDCRKKQTEQEIRKEKLRVLEKISGKLKTGTEARDRKEQEILDNALQLAEAKRAARVEADRSKVEAQVAERRQQRRLFLQDEARRLREEETFKKWQLLNRYKSVDLTEEFERKLKEKEWQKTLEYRAELLALWKEREERDAKEAEDRRYFYGELAERALRDADNKVLRHAELLRQEAVANGWPWLPLHRTLEHYRKMYALFPAKPLPNALKEHFQHYAPEDRTFPQELPALPPPDYERRPRRCPTNGLQDVDQKPEKQAAPRSAKPKADDPPTEEELARRSAFRNAEWKCYQGEEAARRLRQAEVEARRHAAILRRECEHAAKPPPPTLAQAVETKVIEQACEDYRRQGKVNGLQQKLPEVKVIPLSGGDCF